MQVFIINLNKILFRTFVKLNWLVPFRNFNFHMYIVEYI